MKFEERKLTKEEIGVLLKYIAGKGFKHHDIQLEILDHFACKVEEILSLDKTMPLEAAMDEAHSSFGVMGFSVIEDSYKKKLGIEFFKEIPKVWIEISQGFLGFLLLMGMLGFLLFLFSPFYVEYANIVRIGLGVTFIIISLVLLSRYKPISKNYFIYSNMGTQILLFVNFCTQFLILPFLWEHMSDTISRLIMFSFALLITSILIVLNKQMKYVIERVNDLEIKTNYSKFI